MYQDRHFPRPEPKRPIRRFSRIWLPVIVTSFGLLLIGAALAGANLRIVWIGSTLLLSAFLVTYAFSVSRGRRRLRSENRDLA